MLEGNISASGDSLDFRRQMEIAHWKGKLLEEGKKVRKRELRDCALATARDTLVLRLAKLSTEARPSSALARPGGLSEQEFDREIYAVVDAILGDPSIAEESVSGPFRLDEDGLWYIQPDKNGENWRERVCSYIEVAAATRDENGEQWGRLIRVKDPEDRMHEWAMPMDTLVCDGTTFLQKLVSLGLILEPGPTPLRRLREYLSIVPDRRIRAVNALGWHRENVFVLPDEVIGETGSEDFIYQSSVEMEHAFRVAGTVEDWRDNIARFCAGNSRLVFAVCCAFAAPLLSLLDTEGGGFNLMGPSSIGKTTALRVAASVWGGGSGGYIRRWRATANGLEGMASVHSDSLLCLDELSQMPVKDAGEAAYMLANGQGKARARTDGTVKKPMRWRVLFLSSGEITLHDKIAESGRRALGGQLVRVIDVPADPGCGLGLFENLHEIQTAEMFADHLKQQASTYYGAPIRQFLRQLTANRVGAELELHKNSAPFFNGNCPNNADPQVQRGCRRFALVAAAGELATLYGITGWPAGEATKAAALCFGAWLEERGHTGSADMEEAIAQIRKFIQMHGDSRFSPWGREQEQTLIIYDRAGYRRKSSDGDVEFLVHTEVFRKELCQGFHAASVARELAHRGILTPGKKELSRTERPPGSEKTIRFYCVTSKILEEQSDAPAVMEEPPTDHVTGVTSSDVVIQ